MKKVLFVLALAALSACALFLACGKKGGEDAPSYAISEKLFDPFNRFVGNVESEMNYGQKKIKVELAVKNDSNYDDRLVVDGQTIDVAFAGVTEIQIIDDVIVFVAYGTDDLSAVLYAFAMGGEKLLEIRELDGNGMRIFNNYVVSGAFGIEGDKIIIHGSRLYLGTDLMYGGEKSVVLTHDGVDWTDLVPDDEAIRADYELPYLGGGEFGELAKIETTMTYAQLKEIRKQH